MAEQWESDEELLADLRAALQAEAEVPAWFSETGKAALEWRGLDGELATLTEDSATTAPAGARAEPASLRSLTFTGREVTIGIEVDADELHGQIAPPRAGEIEVRPRRGPVRRLPVDELGWFAIRPKPAGAFRLCFTSAGGHVVLTEWTTV
ncbi:hypothetical protein [Amycolatopsis solani]|uniref:hypothetical protein n=1 Tax=Amycolatopsis solani TaxID=3028615 RepID=UPI0025B10D22|nr:hypothetical protein [Amycolatopsis sp. MEP2-6]